MATPTAGAYSHMYCDSSTCFAGGREQMMIRAPLARARCMACTAVPESASGSKNESS